MDFVRIEKGGRTLSQATFAAAVGEGDDLSRHLDISGWLALELARAVLAKKKLVS
jgi:hypothetical protein